MAALASIGGTGDRSRMQQRHRTVLAVVGIVANLVGIVALSLPWFAIGSVADSTTTMVWVEGYVSPWVPWLHWAWVALSVAGLATVVVALRGRGETGAAVEPNRNAGPMTG